MSNEFEKENEEKKKGALILGKKEKIFLIIIALITVAAIAVTVWALFFRKPDDSGLTPDYAPESTEDSAILIPDDTNKDKLESPDGGGAVSLSYTKDVAIDISEEKAVLNFANPYESTQDMVVQIVIQDVILVQSGRLTPGHKVNQLDLLEGAAKKLQAGKYEGKLVILFYDQASGEKAMLNAEIPVTIKVVD